MLVLKGVTRTFKKDSSVIPVLKGIDLEIAAGETLAILGVSGSGKTTLLQVMGLLDRPTTGSVWYNGSDAFAGGEREQAWFRNRKIGFVFQFHHLLPEFSAVENVMMPARIGGVSRKEARVRAETALTEVGLGDRLAHKPGELSGGEQQRVAVARAIIMEPAILLADEPTGNLDAATGRNIEDLLIALNRNRGTTLVIVTHNDLLARCMSRTLGLKDGTLHEV